MTISLTGAQAKQARSAVHSLHTYVLGFDHKLKSVFGGRSEMPSELATLLAAIERAEQALHAGERMEAAVEVDDECGPILACSLSFHRREFVSEIEKKRRQTTSAELLERLDQATRTINDMLAAPWYVSAQPPRIPQLRDFLIERTDYPRVAPQPPTPLKRDDKFGILLSASELLTELEIARRNCEERNAPIAIAFVDVDGLKQINLDYTETMVDALVLPQIMRAVDQVAFGHGQAYRYGGDEFVIVMPSTDERIAANILTRLTQVLAETRYGLEIVPPTASVGVCVVLPGSPLTESEALHWAALAKRYAKEDGRNRIALVTAGVTVTNPAEPKAANGEASAFRVVLPPADRQ